MPYKFTPSEPIQYHEFNFKRFIEYSVHNSVLQQLPFVQEWKIRWLHILFEQDKYVKEYIKEHPGTNPLLGRVKANPKQFK
ncbi:hypothetical protein [Parageobacillus toebii]|uniref:hypothetical protein n=1 Tax=Parageobacillus toebii TaxID=153151 RepID=UPI001966E0A7|nr:hypothetical protein [Parageobacillus toebii]QSB49679.1 hypothetical protein JTI59_05360 [Parageobacillus toebii]